MLEYKERGAPYLFFDRMIVVDGFSGIIGV